MKHILVLVLAFQLFSSCEKKTATPVKQTATSETKTAKEEIYGNLQLNEDYNLLSKNEVTNDSLKGRDFFNHNFKEVTCKCSIHRDYYNDIDNYMIRETEILIDNKIKISVFYKSKEDYIYTYNGKPFKIKNYYGTMFHSDSDNNFFFDTRECYMISKTKFLMREQPSDWCGLANQYEIYQMVDLEKMEMIQFAERDDKIKMDKTAETL